MKIERSLIISIALHIALLLISYFNINTIFSSKVKDKGYAVFDFVTIDKKSKAPVLSETEGKLSKSKARTDEKEVVTQKSQPSESIKSEKKKSENKKETRKIVPEKKKKQEQKKQKKIETKKKPENKSNASDKAVVNLRKNKKTQSTDKKVAKKSFNSLLDGAIAQGENENTGIKAEEVGDVLTATQIDLIRQTIRKCWHFPAGLRNAEDLVVDIRMELDHGGNVKKAEIVDKNRMAADPDFRTAAENAYRAVLDPKCNPLPLPKEHYEEWKDLELSFNPKDMFE